MDDQALFEQVPDDGLWCPEVGAWAIEKHKLLALYASLFANSMRSKWEVLVYADLFSGCGRCKYRGEGGQRLTSPSIVAHQELPFDYHVFCDSDERNIDLLRLRLERDRSRPSYRYVNGDINEKVDEFLNIVPTASKERRVLTFCFLDPYSIENLRFDTIRRISTLYVDFLVLIPSGMDANRNVRNYTRKDSEALDTFLGRKDWRESWTGDAGTGASFEQFVVKEFGKSMRSLRYLDPGMENTQIIRSSEKNLLLYRLVLYSRHQLGSKFWSQARKYSTPQRGLF